MNRGDDTSSNISINTNMCLLPIHIPRILIVMLLVVHLPAMRHQPTAVLIIIIILIMRLLQVAHMDHHAAPSIHMQAWRFEADAVEGEVPCMLTLTYRKRQEDKSTPCAYGQWSVTPKLTPFTQ